jgi:hypothetical protein
MTAKGSRIHSDVQSACRKLAAVHTFFPPMTRSNQIPSDRWFGFPFHRGGSSRPRRSDLRYGAHNYHKFVQAVIPGGMGPYQHRLKDTVGLNVSGQFVQVGKLAARVVFDSTIRSRGIS